MGITSATNNTPADRKRDIRLLAILVAFIALSLAYSFATRLKFGPDEPAHFIYIRSLAVDFSPPPISHNITPSEYSESSHEGHQPPLYYAIMAVSYAALDALGASNDTIWRILRLLDIPIGALWICLVYLLALEFSGKRDHALAATAFVALIPTSSYMAGVISNDMLIALIFTWALILILRYFKTGTITIMTSAVLGLAIGLAMLAKAQGMILVPTFLVVCFLVARGRGYENASDVARSAVITLGIAAIVSGWWFAWCRVRYGSIMPRSLSNPVIEGGLLNAVFFPMEAARATWVSTYTLCSYFWVPLWLVERFIRVRLFYFYPLCVLTVIGAIGFVLRLRRNGNIDRRSLRLLLFVAGITYLVWLRYVMVVDFMANLQGRLFLPVASVIGIAAVLGFDGLFRSPRAKKAGLIAGLALMILVNFAVIGCAIALYSDVYNRAHAHAVNSLDVACCLASDRHERLDSKIFAERGVGLDLDHGLRLIHVLLRSDHLHGPDVAAAPETQYRHDGRGLGRFQVLVRRYLIDEAVDLIAEFVHDERYPADLDYVPQTDGLTRDCGRRDQGEHEKRCYNGEFSSGFHFEPSLNRVSRHVIRTQLEASSSKKSPVDLNFL